LLIVGGPPKRREQFHAIDWNAGRATHPFVNIPFCGAR
jgi:hypothetical protein